MSSIHGQDSAGRCMDGEHTDDDSVCRTEKELAPWIAFDFGKEVEVGSVVIFSGVDERAEKIMNLDVRVTTDLPEDGNSKFTGGKSLGSFIGRLEQCQRIMISSPEPLNGKYVLIQMSHGTADYLSFHEVIEIRSTNIAYSIVIDKTGSNDFI